MIRIQLTRFLLYFEGAVYFPPICGLGGINSLLMCP
jgi:hypothetical protein